MNFKEIPRRRSIAKRLWEDKNEAEGYYAIILEFPEREKPFDLGLDIWTPGGSDNKEENIMIQQQFSTLEKAKEGAEKFLEMTKNFLKETEETQ